MRTPPINDFFIYPFAEYKLFVYLFFSYLESLTHTKFASKY